ncbi:MAG: maleylacetoacetate isomerase [Proteobacteria bacterium]|nr:maleylacetoacetate isomerase [Pseudomonadota bacterium]
MKLHGYFRSGAAYRVRIALNLKGVEVEHVPHHLRKGEQKAEAYLKLNPQGLVPALELDDGTVLTQSLAIIDWLDETHPLPPLVPGTPIEKAKIRGFALAIACDTHPVQNLGVLKKLRALGHSEAEANAWAADVNHDGLASCEILLAGTSGPYCFGAVPTLADVCLVPQMANARRFGVDLTPFPRIVAADAAARAHPAFAAAAPDLQPDAE